MWYLQNKKFEYWAYAENYFSNEECDSIIKFADENLKFEQASISGNGTFDTSIRKNSIAWFDHRNKNTEWLHRKLVDAVLDMNSKFWEFDLEYMETLQFTRYQNKNDGYAPHVDMGVNCPNFRKLSFSVQLSDENSYTGSDLVIMTTGRDESVVRNRGTINFFPSFLLHKVTPLLSGKRDALVGWVCGPTFK